MRILLFSGSHPRHLYFHNKVVETGDVCGVVVFQREEIIPTAPEGTLPHDVKNFDRHFADRATSEKKIFGSLSVDDVFTDIPMYLCETESDLNSEEVASFVRELTPDVVVIFGTDLIKDPVFSALPRDKVNIHLGLSPWYKGSATLFWPFYNLQPNHAGVTIHQIVAEADAGAIIHQCVPTFEKGDGIHDIGCKAVQKVSEDIVRILKYRKMHGKFIEHKQKSSGRLYLTTSFKPEHLRVIYDLYDNKLVDEYIEGRLMTKEPKLIQIELD